MTTPTTITEQLEQRLEAYGRAAQAATETPTGGRKAAATRRLRALQEQWNQDIGGTDDEFTAWLRGEIPPDREPPAPEAEPEAPPEEEKEEATPGVTHVGRDYDKSPFETTSAEDGGRITMNAKSILGLLPHVSKEESRPTLHGVLLRSDGVAIATNGHALAMYRHAHNSTEDVLVVFPPEASKLLRKADEIWLKGETLEYPLVDGRCLVERREDANLYPKIEAVLPKSKGTKLGALGINPNVLACFKENVKDSVAVKLTFYGETKAIGVTTSDPCFYGLVMPCRTVDKGDSSKAPEWTNRKD